MEVIDVGILRKRRNFLKSFLASSSSFESPQGEVRSLEVDDPDVR